MKATTIRVLKATRDRLHRLAAAHGLASAQQIDRLIDESAAKSRPTIGGFRSDRPLSDEEIDGELARGFGK